MLTFCSACWEDLKGVAKERQDQLQRAEECHRFYRDLTDALTLIKVTVYKYITSVHHVKTRLLKPPCFSL